MRDKIVSNETEQSQVGQTSLMWERAVSCGTQLSNEGQNRLMLKKTGLMWVQTNFPEV